MGPRQAVVTPTGVGAPRVMLVLGSRQHHISVYEEDPVTSASAFEQAWTIYAMRTR